MLRRLMRFKAVRFFSFHWSICFVQVVHVVKVPHLLALGFSIKGAFDEISKSRCQAVIAIIRCNPFLRATDAAITSLGDLSKRWRPT